MIFEVAVEAIAVRSRQGVLSYAYRGAKLRGDAMDPVQAEHLLAEGLIVEVAVVAAPDDDDHGEGDLDPADAAALAAEDDFNATQGSADPGVEKPPRIALKSVLVDWLVDNTEGYSRDDLEKLNKDDLWDLIDAVDAPEATGSGD